MDVSFKTNRLQRNYEDSARAIRQWGFDVARRYVTRVNELYAVKDIQEAFAIRSMRVHPLKGSGSGKLSIYLTGRWRLIVTKGNTEASVVIEEVSNHHDD